MNLDNVIDPRYQKIGKRNIDKSCTEYVCSAMDFSPRAGDGLSLVGSRALFGLSFE